MASSFNNLAVICNKLDESDRAETLALRALSIRLQAGDQSAIANSYNNLALIYRARGDEDEAISHYDPAYSGFMPGTTGPMVNPDTGRPTRPSFNFQATARWTLTTWLRVPDVYPVLGGLVDAIGFSGGYEVMAAGELPYVIDLSAWPSWVRSGYQRARDPDPGYSYGLVPGCSASFFVFEQRLVRPIE